MVLPILTMLFPTSRVALSDNDRLQIFITEVLTTKLALPLALMMGLSPNVPGSPQMVVLPATVRI